jgi:conjugative relaxase-like TrwC/TraI family protein
VLTISKVASGVADEYAAYLQGKAQPSALGDYYLKDGERVEAPGRWVSGAATVGVSGTERVAVEHLRALMAVQRPDTSAPLRRTGGDGEAVSAIDATFSAPKSVSAVWAVSAPEERRAIERAHENAIDRALRYALEHVSMVRERLDARTVVHCAAADMVATSWRHTTARAVESRSPDPQLHSHVLLHAAVREDGRIVAIDSRRWFVHRREVGAAYRTELARELGRLGFRIERGTGRGGRYFEIEGVPQKLLDRWSSRHHQVREGIARRLEARQAALEAIAGGAGPRAIRARAQLGDLRRHGRLAPAEDRRIAWSTRSAKDFATHQHLDRHWQNDARRAGLSIRVLRDQNGPTSSRPAAAGDLLSRLTEFDATFTEREARAVALEASAGVSIATALSPLPQLRDAGELVKLADGQLTTRAHRALERSTIQGAERLASDEAEPMAHAAVTRETLRLDRELAATGGSLSPEQHAAISTASSDRRLVFVVGQAGSGKSTALTGICRVHQDSGQRILVTSTAGLAAERLAAELEAAGVHASPYSTSALHAGVTAGRIELGPDVTVIHDEAALASTQEQHRLIVVVAASGARLIEVGDPSQSQPVGAGGLWTHLENEAKGHGARVELTQNVRALDPADRRDQALFRAGQHERSLFGYAVRRRITARTLQDDAEEKALEAAHCDRRAGKHTLVIAQTTNEHLDELNARAQALRDHDGELGSDRIAVPGRPYDLHAGDHVQVRRGVQLPVGGKVRNGTVGTVVSVDVEREQLVLRLGDERVVPLSREYVDRADLRLAYVQHPFPAQGQTTDTTHLIIGDHASREGTYVGLTRGRDRTQLYTSLEQLSPDATDVGLLALAEVVGRSEPAVPSIRTPLAFVTPAAEVVPDEQSQRSRHDDRVHEGGPATRDVPEPEVAEDAADRPGTPAPQGGARPLAAVQPDFQLGNSTGPADSQLWRADTGQDPQLAVGDQTCDTQTRTGDASTEGWEI